MNDITALIQKEIRLEWRQRYALNGMLLYVVTTVFVTYLSFRQRAGHLDPNTWNTLFWIVMLFTAVSAVAKSFTQERAGRMLYYYTLTGPTALMAAKLLYNTALLLGLSLLCYGLYGFVMGNPVGSVGQYLVCIGMASLGFAGTLTLVSGIAAKAENSPTLMSVLSFPILLPMLLVVLKLSKNALDGLEWAASRDELLTLLALNGIVWALSLVLFPYLWRS